MKFFVTSRDMPSGFLWESLWGRDFFSWDNGNGVLGSPRMSFASIKYFHLSSQKFNQGFRGNRRSNRLFLEKLGFDGIRLLVCRKIFRVLFQRERGFFEQRFRIESLWHLRVTDSNREPAPPVPINFLEIITHLVLIRFFNVVPSFYSVSYFGTYQLCFLFFFDLDFV